MIALIDYQAGNLTSVAKALDAIGAEVVVPSDPDQLARATGLIVPGVGHFGATRAISRRWVEAILDRVECGRPLLGICLGMQWLYESSAEAPELSGLGVMAGTCERLAAAQSGIKVPHVGWNSLEILRDAWITEGVPNGAHVYYTHSYAAPHTGDTVAVTEHGVRFAAVVQRGSIAGVQFHPEKSGDVGLRILENFVGLCA